MLVVGSWVELKAPGLEEAWETESSISMSWASSCIGFLFREANCAVE